MEASMCEENLAFYERRARQEAEAAASAVSPAVASAHRLLSIQYEDDIREQHAAHPHPQAVHNRHIETADG
ncbi:hypothetical protein C1T17_20545 (plasmid) [Sphingobium sp. SCG-1]|nr:hypothetical protein C1T17_20545 [Sphingobium sp. SCG-1]